MLTRDNYFPNGQLYAWTHGGVYYTISVEGRIFASNNKFKYDSYPVGVLPLECRYAWVYPANAVTQSIDLNPASESSNVLRNMLIQGNTIFVEIELITDSESETRYYVSRSHGVFWQELNNVVTQFPDHVTAATRDQWRNGCFAFMTIDSSDCHAYFYKPLLVQAEDGTLKIDNWYVHRSDDRVIHNPASSVMNTMELEQRFRASGSTKTSYSNRLNNMDSHHEEFRKPYALRWPSLIDIEDDPETIDHSGHLVNPFDTINYKHGNNTYAVVRVIQELTVRTGLIANDENNYKPDYLTTRVPIFYVINVDDVQYGTQAYKCPIRVLDLLGFDTFLTPLHTAQYTLRQGVYSYLSALLGKDFSIEDTYGKAGTVYDYSVTDNTVFTNRPNFQKFVELCSGDLMKMTDPTNNKDVVAFLARDRIKVCVDDPTKEYNWIDKTTESTFVRPHQKVRASESIVLLTEDTTNQVTPVFNSWCTYDTVLRYDYENNRVLGYPVYDNSVNEIGRLQNLVGYVFPSLIKTSGGNYTIGTVRNSNSSVLMIPTTTAQYTTAYSDVPSNFDTDLFYGGFVGSERGFIGSLRNYVVGIDTPEEPEFPPTITEPPPEEPGAPLAAPSVFAVLDDVKKSTTAAVAPNRRAVSFGLLQGSVISNIGVGAHKWYLEISNFSSHKIYFGLASIDFDVDKEPGQASNVLAVDLNGVVRKGGSLIYQNQTPLVTDGIYDNQVIGIKIDMVNRLLQFTNGDGQWVTTAIVGMPAGDVYFYVGASPSSWNQSSIAVNFGQDPFKYNVPNGYVSGYGIK